jgi:16S rRNA (adenine1518-N6/adenine1519-N6)-dimethyltransferase
MVLMLQREVVARITAPPSSSERGYLSVLVEAYASAETLFDVSPASFRPVPKVWSTVLRLVMRPRMAVEIGDEALFRQLVSAGFAQRRKTILNNMRAAPEALRLRVEGAGGAEALLEAARVVAQRRAETLTLEEWARMARIMDDPGAGL